jgi:hypothetical protein
MIMMKQLTILLLVLASLTGLVFAQTPAGNTATLYYNGIQFSYPPDDFGAVLPTFDEGTTYQTDAPYFANVAPHTRFAFLRPNPVHPDQNFIGELRVYRIADLEAYAEPTYREAVEELRNLDTSNLSGYANANVDYRTPELPFLPRLNATQVFRAHPHALNFENVQGVEFYTYYSVGLEPILEGQVFYAYQGITTDGKYYLSFSMPVETGILESDIPSNLDRDAFAANYTQYLQDTFSAIQSADSATFNPAPPVLSEFFESIAIAA